MARWSNHIGAAAVMVLGSTMVLGLMAWMNGYTQPPEKQARPEATAIELAPKKPEPKRPKPKPRRQRPKPSNTSRPRTPPPNLGSSLSGVALGGPTALATDFAAAGQSLVGGAGDVAVMTSDAVDDPPRATRRVAPQYPPAARKRGVTGFVTFELTIGADGRVQHARIKASEPAGVFDDAARQVIERWAFSPGTYQGRPQTVTGVEQTIRFQLSRGG